MRPLDIGQEYLLHSSDGPLNAIQANPSFVNDFNQFGSGFEDIGMFEPELENMMDISNEFSISADLLSSNTQALGYQHDLHGVSALSIPGYTSTATNDQSPGQKSLDQDLSDISLKLVELQSWIPPANIHEQASDMRSVHALWSKSRSDDVLHQQPTHSGMEDPPIMEMAMELTQELIDAYVSLSATTLSPNGSHENQPSHDAAAVATSPSTNARGDSQPVGNVLNQSTFFLALSCHHRLIGSWMQIFEHMKVMAELGRFEELAKAKKPPCFQPKIGSFAASSTKATSLFVMNLVHDLLDGLVGAVEDVKKYISLTILEQGEEAFNTPRSIESNDILEMGTGKDTLDKVSLMACEAVSKRSVRLREISERSRQLMNDVGAFP